MSLGCASRANTTPRGDITLIQRLAAYRCHALTELVQTWPFLGERWEVEEYSGVGNHCHQRQRNDLSIHETPAFYPSPRVPYRSIRRPRALPFLPIMTILPPESLSTSMARLQLLPPVRDWSVRYVMMRW